MLNSAQAVSLELPEKAALGASPRISPFEDISQVHAMFEPRIFRFLLYSVRDRDVAMSLTQDTFLRAWRARESFRGDCSVATWLMRIAVNLLRSHTRTQTFRFWKTAAASALDVHEIELASGRSSAEHQMVTRARLTAVWDAVERLPARQRTVFLLRFVEEMELPEIAMATGLALPTVKSHLYRALYNVRAADGVAAVGIARKRGGV